MTHSTLHRSTRLAARLHALLAAAFPLAAQAQDVAPQAAPVATASAAPAAAAPMATVTGVVRAKGSGAPVKDALVIQSDNRDNNTTTDAQGRFSLALSGTAKGLLFRGNGFEDLEIAVEAGKPAEEGPFFLEPAPELQRLGVIRARRKTEVSQQSLQREEMERIPGTGGDAVRGLQSLPSVIAAGPGSADITVRGSAPGDNIYFVDRLEVPFVFHLGGFGSVVPTRMLEGIDLFPGGFSSLYNDAIGGVVQLRTENRIPERTSGQVEVGLLQSSVYLEGNLFEKKTDEGNEATPAGTNARNDGRVGYRAGFRRTYAELYTGIIKKFVDEEKLTLTTLPQATDYQFVLNGNHASGTWQAYLFGAADRVALAAQTRFSDSEGGKSSFSSFNYFETSGLRWNTNLGNGWGLTLSPQQRYTLIDANFFGNKVHVALNDFFFETAVDKRFSQEFSATVGVRPVVARTKTNIDAVQFSAAGQADVFFDPITAPRTTEVDTRTAYYGNAYVDAVWKPVRPLTLNPSVAFLRGRTPSEEAFDPRFNTRYQLTDVHALKAAVGEYSQLPGPQFDSKEYGNPGLKLERAFHYVAGVESKFSSDWETDFQVYYKDMFDLVGNATLQPEKKYENNIKGRSKGFEALVKKIRNGRWAGWVSYGWSRSERRDPLSEKWYLFDFDRTHSANVVASYKITGAWELGTKLQYQTGAPTTRVTGGRFNQATGRYVPNDDGARSSLKSNDARLPAFFQADVRSDYDFLFDTWKLDLYTEITNVTNRQNVVARSYNPDYSKSEDVNGAPIVPSIGVIASF